MYGVNVKVGGSVCSGVFNGVGSKIDMKCAVMLVVEKT